MGDFADDMINRQIERDIDGFQQRRNFARGVDHVPSPEELGDVTWTAARGEVLGYRIPPLEELGDVTWTTIEGEVLKVRDMKPSHRANARRVLVRRHGESRVARSLIGVALDRWKDQP